MIQTVTKITITTITTIIDQVVQIDTVVIGAPNKVCIMLQVLGAAHTVGQEQAVVAAVEILDVVVIPDHINNIKSYRGAGLGAVVGICSCDCGCDCDCDCGGAGVCGIGIGGR